jgi:hypothetical protein
MLIALRRRDFLRDLDFVIGLATVALLVIAGFSVADVVARSAVCADVIYAGATMDVPGLRPGATAGPAVRVCAEAPTWTQAVLGGLVDLPPVLCAAAAAFLLWRVVREARRDNPFTPRTVRRLRWLAGLLFVGGLAASLLASLGSDLLVRTLVDTGHSGYDPPGWAWVFAAVGIAAVAEVVHRGVTAASLDVV